MNKPLARFVTALAFTVTTASAAKAASADEAASLSVSEQGDHLEIIVRGGQAAAANVTSHFDFVELPLVGTFASAEYVDGNDDPTLKRVQLTATGAPRLRIQLHHGASTTAKIAGATRLVAAADGLHVLVPRKEALASWAPTPAPTPAGTNDPVLARTAAVAAPVAAAPVAAAPVAAAIVEGPAAPAKPEAAPLVKPEAAPAAAVVAPVAAPPAPLGVAAPAAAPAFAVKGGAPSGPPTSSVALVVGILAAGGGLVLWARRRRPAAELEGIRVLSSKALGGKARVVLLAAGDRELLLSVSDRGNARLIGRWRRGDTQSVEAIGDTSESDDAEAPALPEGPSRRAGTSPTVSGILKLRRRSGTEPVISPGLGADAEWLRAMAAARTGTDA